MPKQTINPQTLPKAVGYSHIVKAGNLVFVAGQVAVDANGNVVGAGDIEQQARQVYANLKAALVAAGGRVEDVVSTTTYLTSRDYILPIRKAREQFYGANPPASTLLIVSGLARPEFLMEVDAVAAIDG